MTIATVNPATGRRERAFDAHGAPAIEAALDRAATAAAAWRRATFAERSRLLVALADQLDAGRDALAALAMLEMGKTVRSARDEVAKCAFTARHYATHGPALLAAEALRDGDVSGMVRYDPLGVVLAVMPWNFPYWQVIRAAVPAVMAGNAVVLKHASNVPQCALAIGRLFRDAGAPDGLFTTLLVPSGAVAALIADDRIAAVTLTGSEAAGRDVAMHAGRAIKKAVLELGGSDPFIVLHDGDVARAAHVGVTARMLNNGQSCICAKRFLVDRRVADAFEAQFAARVRALRVGDPMADDTDVGPLATRQGRDDVADQLARTIASGARILAAASVPPGEGWYVAPTVLADVPRDSAAATEEVFGPVAPIFRVDGLDDAIALANATPFGLGASVWTSSAETADRCAAELDAGMVFVNAMVASDPRFPFGGVKASGYGREVGVHGLREFVNVKTVRGHAGA
ncbi:MAG TPA: NAD-dependent succinate-semialdehyde dehydrogenase [Gemmatimonadaceae bacterium]|nr:NAD-dependent succinate-semialdehyde dehydrogenase [Gemmatimonadaceae bacterium]